ncbi:MAG TPA: histidinol dehydrogenase [Nitrososphaeraceae archaeon]|nr:histidinol dehydrogenase [Nitrososphaeraceae archaeon]
MKRLTIKNAKVDVDSIRYNIANNFSDDAINKTRDIIENVRKHGDDAIKKYTSKFDKVELDSFKVNHEEIKEAYNCISEDHIKTIKLIRDRLIKNETIFLEHLKKISSLYPQNENIQRIIQPIASVGCYVPGGSARYPSTLIMCVTPAKLAGVKRIVTISPTKNDGKIDPLTLVSADICGVDEIYKIGGAQGIAGLAFGTESIKKVDKIVGPGGMYVTIAKLLVSNIVSIDMLAGPTELVIYADDKSNAKYVALDLISQSEHSKDTLCGLVTDSHEFANKVEEEINNILAKKISRQEIVTNSLHENGFIAVSKNEDSAIEFVNEIAPEHLQIMAKNELKILNKITSAGLVLLGENTPSAASDYCLGSNHVLPTMGFGKSRTSLSILDFVRISNIVRSSKKEIEEIEPFVKIITQEEGLLNHYKAVKERTIDI